MLPPTFDGILAMANKITVSDDPDEAESAEYYVCVRASTPAKFDDDLYDFCCLCSEKVRYRPHGPTAPKKVCLECVSDDLEKQVQQGKLEVVLTNRVIQEIQKLTTKKN